MVQTNFWSAVSLLLLEWNHFDCNKSSKERDNSLLNSILCNGGQDKVENRLDTRDELVQRTSNVHEENHCMWTYKWIATNLKEHRLEVENWKSPLGYFRKRPHLPDGWQIFFPLRWYPGLLVPPLPPGFPRPVCVAVAEIVMQKTLRNVPLKLAGYTTLTLLPYTMEMEISIA